MPQWFDDWEITAGADSPDLFNDISYIKVGLPNHPDPDMQRLIFHCDNAIQNRQLGQLLDKALSELTGTPSGFAAQLEPGEEHGHNRSITS